MIWIADCGNVSFFTSTFPFSNGNDDGGVSSWWCWTSKRGGGDVDQLSEADRVGVRHRGRYIWAKEL